MLIHWNCVHSLRSFTLFNYSNIIVKPSSIKAGENVSIAVSVTNIGNRDGDEVSVIITRVLSTGRVREKLFPQTQYLPPKTNEILSGRNKLLKNTKASK